MGWGLDAALGGAMGTTIRASARIAGVITGVGAVDEKAGGDAAPLGRDSLVGTGRNASPIPASMLRPILSSANREARRSPCTPGLASASARSSSALSER